MKRLCAFLLAAVLLTALLPAAVHAKMDTSVTFTVPENVVITVYHTRDVNGAKDVGVTVVNSRSPETGEEVFDGTGEVNFSIGAADGYRILSDKVQLGGPAGIKYETETVSGIKLRRITGITGPVTVTVTAEVEKTGAPADHYTVTFTLDPQVSATVYNTRDITGAQTENATTAYARSEDGSIDISGNGEVNFSLSFAAGYKLNEIRYSDGASGLLKPATTGNGTFRLTGIHKDASVIITAKEDGDTPPVKPEHYVVTFRTDEHVSVTVYETRSTSGPKTENAATAYARDGFTGEVKNDGTGEVNFALVFDEGYTLDKFHSDDAGSGQLVQPGETGNGTYRLKNIETDISVSLTSKKRDNPTQECKADFVLPEGVTVTVYETRSTSGPKTENATTAYARDAAGSIDFSGMGEINFALNFAPGCYLGGIKFSGSCADTAKPDVTGNGTYRICGVSGLVTVTVNATYCVCWDYSDVNRGMWYHEAVDYMIEHGLMGSTSQTEKKFEPSTTTTRAMIVSILYRLGGNGETVPYTAKFPDVKQGKWYTDAVLWASKYKIVSGYSNGNFGPNDTVTREQMAVILMQFAKATGKFKDAAADLSIYADASKVTWSKAAVQWAVSVGILSGKGINGKVFLDPQGNASRAEVASILQRFIGNVLHL